MYSHRFVDHSSPLVSFNPLSFPTSPFIPSLCGSIHLTAALTVVLFRKSPIYMAWKKNLWCTRNLDIFIYYAVRECKYSFISCACWCMWKINCCCHCFGIGLRRSLLLTPSQIWWSCAGARHFRPHQNVVHALWMALLHQLKLAWRTRTHKYQNIYVLYYIWLALANREIEYPV